jgi:hypothetical protein
LMEFIKEGKVRIEGNVANGRTLKDIVNEERKGKRSLRLSISRFDRK